MGLSAWPALIHLATLIQATSLNTTHPGVLSNTHCSMSAPLILSVAAGVGYNAVLHLCSTPGFELCHFFFRVNTSQDTTLGFSCRQKNLHLLSNYDVIPPPLKPETRSTPLDVTYQQQWPTVKSLWYCTSNGSIISWYLDSQSTLSEFVHFAQASHGFFAFGVFVWQCYRYRPGICTTACSTYSMSFSVVSCVRRNNV